MAPKVSEAYKRQKRQEILEAALICFGEMGYERTSIDEIVIRSGISKGAIYNYFASKEEVYCVLIEQRDQDFFHRLQQALSIKQLAGEKLSYVINTYREYSHDETNRNIARFYLETWLHASSKPDLQQIMKTRYDRFVEFLSEIIKEGIASQEFNEKVNPSDVISLVQAFRDGILLHMLVVEDWEKAERCWSLFEEMLINTLRNKG